MKNIFTFGILLILAINANAQPGTLDVTYGNNGQVFMPSSTQNRLYDSAIQSDGKIIVVGDSDGNNEGSSFLISRYMPNGNIDTSFGSNGNVEILVGQRCHANSIELQNDGKIVVSGSTLTLQGNTLYTDIMVIRLNTNGNLDPTFDEDGINTINLNNSQTINAAIIQESGKIILAGRFSNLSNPNFDTFGLVRFNEDGSTDTTFGVNGFVHTQGFNRGEILDLKNTEAGDIIAIGNIPITNLFAIVKYNSEGILINSFGSNGNGIITGSYGEINNFRNCTIFNNNIYIVGAVNNGTKYNSLITKYDINGTIANDFGQDGKILKDFGTDISSFANDVEVDNNGNLIIGYGVGMTNNYDMALQSYSINGELNTSFGTNGYFTTSFSSGQDYLRSVSIQDDNKIIIVGMSADVQTLNQSLARVLNEENLSMGDIESVNQYSITPNPFTTNIVLSLSLKKSHSLTAELYDITGKLIGTVLDKTTFQQGNRTINLNLSSFNLHPSVYFVKIYKDDGISQTLKIVKN